MTEKWAPQGIDTQVPSTARIYDYVLGGKDNFPVDRQAAEKVYAAFSEATTMALANRGFLVEAVRAATAAGITQFLDLGTGLPTSPNVHEVARRKRPDARVVYVDHDPIVTAHNQALRAVDANIGVIEVDIRDPAAVLGHSETHRLLDFTEPVAVLAVAVLHFVTDAENPREILGAYRDVMAPGSHLALTAVTTENMTADELAQAREAWRDATSSLTLRERDHIATWFDGLELVEPGLASPAAWCNNPGLETRTKFLAGIGRKP